MLFFLAGISEFFLWVLVISLIIFTLTDYWILFSNTKGMNTHRTMSELLSNGDDNEVTLQIRNQYSFGVRYEIIDELPIQFQIRDFNKKGYLDSRKIAIETYTLHPTKRGEYRFGSINVYVNSPIGLIKRRYSFENEWIVACYPSLIQMQQYALMAVSKFANQFGIKRVRRMGHSREFELIKDYTLGDDMRTINWKATARKSSLMVNHYEDEKSQPLFCVIDKGRAMRLTFEGMNLMDYSINASLALSNIALQKKDKVGLITFSDRLGTHIPAENGTHQLKKLLLGLYGQKTSWGESNFEFLYSSVRQQLKQRSLILLFTAFDSVASMERQLPYILRLNRFHLVLVVFFQDTELETILKEPVSSLKEIYMKTIAGKFSVEKQFIAKELQKKGILSLLTSPKALTVNLINKYLEIKNQGRL